MSARARRCCCGVATGVPLRHRLAGSGPDVSERGESRRAWFGPCSLSATQDGDHRAGTPLLMMGNSRLIACGALLVAVCAGAPGAVAADGAGNPYTFYGSIAECASAQRARCEACVADHSCAAITDASDGNAECMTLGDSNGRGYFLICIDLALAIDAVA